MKTMQKSGDVIRVKDFESEDLKKDGWNYVPKSVWKSKNRKEKDDSKKTETKDTKLSNTKNKKS